MTGLTSNIGKLIEHFQGVAQRSRSIDVVQALTVGVNAARGAMSNRIFNRGEDASGTKFGKYTGKKIKKATKPSRALTDQEQKAKDFLFGEQSEFSEYELVRIRAGRQIQFKDLEFLGSLRRGIQVVTINDKKVACAIPNDELFNIAKYQEQQIGRILGEGTAQIFSPSKDELELMRTNTLAALNQIYVRVFNT